MAQMVDLIRDGSAPPSVMRRAAQGGLSLPAGEAIEILVVLTGHRELGTEAEQTLLNWNEGSLLEVASDPQTSPEVLRQILRLHGQRPAAMEASVRQSCACAGGVGGLGEQGRRRGAAGHVAERAGTQRKPTVGVDNGESSGSAGTAAPGAVAGDGAE